MGRFGALSHYGLFTRNIIICYRLYSNPCGFLYGFLVINYNKKKELRRLKEIENNKKLPHRYFGDDTV